MNPKFHHYFMDVARRTAQLSPARRLQVGAVAVKDRRIICCGYNGTGPGEDNNCEDELPDGTLVTKPGVKHAEQNLIDFAKLMGINLFGCTLYITHGSCIDCARNIIDAGFFHVIYDRDFRCDKGVKYLNDNWVGATKFSDLINGGEV